MIGRIKMPKPAISEKARRAVATHWLQYSSRIVGVYVLMNVAFLASCHDKFNPEADAGAITKLAVSLFASAIGTALWYAAKSGWKTLTRQLQLEYDKACREYDREN